MKWYSLLILPCLAGFLHGAPAITDPPANGTGSVTIPEDTATGTPIFTLQPAPQPTWSYTITSPSTSPFTINTGGSVVLSGTLDYDTGTTSYVLTLQVTDTSDNSTTDRALTVFISNVYDVLPNLTGPAAIPAVDEEMRTGATIMKFTATDQETPDGDVLDFSLLGPDAGYFKIDPTTGDITIRSRIDYDAGITSLSFTTQVTDRGGNVALQAVTVPINDINDNSPVCSPAVVHATVTENTAAGYSVPPIVCTDADSPPNSNLTYTIFSGDDTTPKFTLSGTTVTTTTAALDYEKKTEYSLFIYAIDTPVTSPKKTATVTMNIEVAPVNDDSPVWATTATAFSIPESSPPGTVVALVTAKDPDSGTDGTISYQLVSTTASPGGSVSGVFVLDAITGKLSTLVKLDRENVQSYDVAVKATDGGTLPKSTPDLTLTVTVTDINDNVPTLTGTSVLTGSIPEDATVGTSILTLVASDADLTSTLTFSILSGDVISPKFRFNTGKPGQLETNNVFDLDLPTKDADIWRLTVIVTDGGSPELTGTTYVTVTVTPVNDNLPVFNTPLPAATVQIPENTKPGTSVMTVGAFDKDIGKDGTLTYTITGGNTGSTFLIDSLTGEIRTQTSLNFETVQRYDLEVTATDGGTSPSASNTIVTVLVTDINEDAPTCTTYNIILSIPEDTTTPVALTSLNCRDANPGDTLAYSVVSGSPQGMFLVNGATGEIALTQKLDFETRVVYDLRVKVVDDGTPPLSVVVFVKVKVSPVNEASPIFSPSVYTATVTENSASGSPVVQVTATDADLGASDGTLRYGITSGDPQGRFAIDRTTGQITVANPLDREFKDGYNLTVTATDGVPGDLHVVSTYVYVSVRDANDNRPIFNPTRYVTSVSEDAKPLSVILTVTATDDDLPGSVNTRVSYNIASGDMSNVFEFSGAYLRIASSKSLKFATKSIYNLVIESVDQGMPVLRSTATVVINILPANQNTPVFTNPRQSISIPETLPVGSRVITATATDADSGIFGNVSYSIIDRNLPTGTFVVDSVSGDVLVWSELDRDLPPTQYNLTLNATDGGGTSATTWLFISLLDVNDNFPLFEKNIFYIDVNEDVSISTTIAQLLATDADTGTNGEITYSFISGDGATSFTIDSSSGYVTTSVKLDYEKKNKYSIVVMATDKGTPSTNTATSLVVININDVNDNTPVFIPDKLTVDLTENVAIGTNVVNVVATDADSAANNNNAFLYQLLSSVFQIDAKTGEITTVADIDRDRKESYVLTVTARDQNGIGVNIGTGTVTVSILDENDNEPVITGTYIKTLPENTAVGTVIYTITATDADSGRNAQLTYVITAGDPTNDFRIEATSGILQLNKPLNREVTPSYALTINVTDNGVFPLFDTATVFLSVSDRNDNSPIFQNLPYTLSIAENVPPGSIVGYVTALDADIGVNGDVVYDFVIFWQGNKSHFNINAATGEITTNGGLDRETQNTYLIWLRATDNGVPWRSAETNISITITDVNDHDPVFDSLFYSASIREDLPVLSSILTMTVTDKDIGVNGAINLYIDTTTTEGTRANNFFLPSRPSGILSLKSGVDRETDDVFVFIVIAVDGGLTPRTASSTVTVTVIDINDNSPVMSPSFYNTEVAYTGVCDNTITTVSATDADLGTNGQFSYYLLASTYSFLFAVDQTSGIVSLQNRATVNSRYLISVSARDSGTPVLAATPAVIRVDTFNPIAVAVTFQLSIDLATFEAQKALFISSLQNIIRGTYPTAIFRIWCVVPRGDNSGSPVLGRRKLLQNTSPVNVYTYTVAGNGTDSPANVNQSKTFLSSSQTLQFFSADPLGTPKSALTDGALNYFGIEAVTRYYDPVTPWTQTLEGILVITFIAVVIAILLAVIVVVAIFTCRKKKRPVSPVRPKSMKSITVTTPNKDPDVLYMERPAYSDQYSRLPSPEQPVRPRLIDNLKDRKLQPFGIVNREFEGRAVDPVSGLVYAYDTKTNERKWVTTDDGQAVKVTHH